LANKDTKAIIFTDLDGTLLDDEYSFANTQTTISRLLSLEVQIVVCSSKTRSEIEFYRKKLEINDPFISENGAAIFIPRGHFKIGHSYTLRTSQYDIVKLGLPYSVVRRKIRKIRKVCKCKITGFGDMTIEEIAKEAKLTLELAKLAKQREYTEPFRIREGYIEDLLGALRKEGLDCTGGGKYWHIIGNHNKGKAVSILKGFFSEEYRELKTFGLGDQLNDLEMLKVVDNAVVIKEGSNLQSIWEKVAFDIANLSR